MKLHLEGHSPHDRNFVMAINPCALGVCGSDNRIGGGVSVAALPTPSTSTAEGPCSTFIGGGRRFM